VTDLVVIGHGAPAVATAIDAGAFILDEGDGTPFIAAQHRGHALEPEAVVSAAREHAVAGIRYDLLAPLTPRYSVRDLALALNAPVVLVHPAEAGLTGPARLAAEGARGAGLAVAAFVLDDWPDPPSRALLDDRALLYETTEVPVLTLTHGEEPDWPVDDWKDTPPVQRPGETGPIPTRIALEPYRVWEGESPGDPRSAPRPLIMQAMLDIVAAEGPMLASRAYAVYNRAAGGKKLTSVARAPLSNSIYHLAREGKVVLQSEDEIPWQGDDVVRLPDTAPVVVRELGPRELIEVPLDEIAELMRRLGDQPDLKRAVLNTYGLVRMTARAEQYLTTAQELL
jgi:hypothetical protein